MRRGNAGAMAWDGTHPLLHFVSVVSRVSCVLMYVCLCVRRSVCVCRCVHMVVCVHMGLCAHGCLWQRGGMGYAAHHEGEMSACASVCGVRGRGYAAHDEGEQTLNQLLACMDGIDSKGGKGVVRVSLSPLSLSLLSSLALLSLSPLTSHSRTPPGSFPLCCQPCEGV